MSGWIKLHRKMLNWEWYDDTNTKVLYLHILLSANHADNKWRGVTVKAGTMITGLESLSKKTGLTVRQVRTSLSKLISTGEVTSKSSNKYRIISIPNWDSYQQDDRQADSQATSKRQASDKQATANNNDNNVKKEKNINTPLAMLVNMGVDETLASEWIKVRNKKKLASTQTAFDGVRKEAVKAGLTMNDAVKKSVEESWAGFKAAWLDNLPKEQNEYRGPRI